KGGEPERIVLLGIALVADAKARRLQQPHQDREHLVAGQAREREGRAHPSPDRRQGAREYEHAVELVRLADLAPARVIAILLAPARVASRGLQVAALVAADPDAGPGRRDRERGDARERRRVAHALAAWVAILETASPLAP